MRIILQVCTTRQPPFYTFFHRPKMLYYRGMFETIVFIVLIVSVAAITFDLRALAEYLANGCYRKCRHHSVRRVLFRHAAQGCTYVGVIIKGYDGEVYPDWAANFLVTREVGDSDECKQIIESLPLEEWSRTVNILGDSEGGFRFRRVTYYPRFRVYFLGTSDDWAEFEGLGSPTALRDQNQKLINHCVMSLAYFCSDSAVRYPELMRPFVDDGFAYGGERSIAFRGKLCGESHHWRKSLLISSIQNAGYSKKLRELFSDWDSAISQASSEAKSVLLIEDIVKSIAAAQNNVKRLVGDSEVLFLIPGNPTCVITLTDAKLIHLAMVASGAYSVLVRYRSKSDAKFCISPDDTKCLFDWMIILQDRTGLAGEVKCNCETCVICLADGRILHASGDLPITWNLLRQRLS